MASYINTNLASLNAQNNLTRSQDALHTSLQRLSSGLRVNSAKDDAAGLAISERMNAQIKGLAVASRNANDGISLAQTAEGALGVIGNNLQRMRELAVQASNATSSGDIAALDSEYKQLVSENQRIKTTTQFNGTNLLDGSTTSMTFQIGANTADTLAITNTSVSTLTSISAAGTAITLGTTTTTANATLSNLDADIAAVNTARATLGANQSRFQAIISNVATYSENLSAARSRITDTDYAAETANLTRAQILQQAGTAMLAQANQQPNSIMTLLK